MPEHKGGREPTALEKIAGRLSAIWTSLTDGITIGKVDPTVDVSVTGTTVIGGDATGGGTSAAEVTTSGGASNLRVMDADVAALLRLAVVELRKLNVQAALATDLVVNESDIEGGM